MGRSCKQMYGAQVAISGASIGGAQGVYTNALLSFSETYERQFFHL